MGFNKEQIKIDNKRLIESQIEILEKIVSSIIIVSPNKDLYHHLNVLVVEDILDGRGPLIGLHSGLSHSNTEYNYLIACDMPVISKDYIESMLSRIKSQDAIVSSRNNMIEPFHGFYHKRLTSAIKEYVKKDNAFQSFIQSINTTIIPSDNKDLFFNINTPSDLYHLKHKEDTYKVLDIIKITGAKTKAISDYIIDEFPITLKINTIKYVTLLITPTNIKELLFGYLHSEKIIDDITDVKELKINMELNEASITTKNEIDFDTLNKDKLVVSGCGVGTKFHDDIDQIITNDIMSDYKITISQIKNASQELNNRSGLFKLTGGVHSALLLTGNQSIYYEDIGRHNAVDKIVGYTVLNQIDTSSSFLFTSGRISSDMLIKATLAGIPIIISRSAPTSLAVSLAKKYGVTVIGFARGEKLNIYSHSFRIEGETNG